MNHNWEFPFISKGQTLCKQRNQ